MQAGGAGGDNRQVGTFYSIQDGKVSGNHVDDGTRDEEGRNLPRAGLRQQSVGLLDQRQAADPGTDIDADALGVGFGNLDARIADRLDAGGHAELDEDIHATRFFRVEVLRNVKILDLARNLRGEG